MTTELLEDLRTVDAAIENRLERQREAAAEAAAAGTTVSPLQRGLYPYLKPSRVAASIAI